MELQKEDRELLKRLRDLANKSFSQNMYTFTDFLSTGEMSVYYQYEREFTYAGTTVFGGYDDAERCIIRFGNPKDLGYEEEFRISCLKITPLIAKFSDTLTHRDYLGSVMNLGIDRAVTGDILIQGKEAYLYCKSDMKDYIIDNLSKIKHTSIRLCEVSLDEAVGNSTIEDKEVIVASTRVDTIIATIYNKSRSQSVELFREHKVFVDGRLYENNSGILKGGELVSVRGYGRFRYTGTLRQTQKGRTVISISIYR